MMLRLPHYEVIANSGYAPGMRDPDEPSLDELLLGAARALRRRWATGLGPDLSPHDARALRVVGHHGPTRIGVVADHLRIAPRSATDVVDRLELRGLVRRSPDPADRRAMTVELTALGESVLSEVDDARRQGAAEFFGSLSDRERASLGTILTKLDRRPG
jgi:DNA-binding MarR family transcriptional regulator